MTATQRRPTRRTQKSASRSNHPTARVAADGRGPRRPVGRRTPLFLALFMSTSMLVALGVIMVLSASAATSIADTNSAWSLFKGQLIWAGVGSVAMLVTMRIDYHVWRRIARPAMVVGLFLLVAVLVPGVGITVNCAARWNAVGARPFQPSARA